MSQAEAEASLALAEMSQDEAEDGPDLGGSWFQNDHFEVYFPNILTPIYPWNPPKMPPIYPWKCENFDAKEFTEDMKYEVRRDITSLNLFDSRSEDGASRISVPITHLCHCTHDEAAEEICTDNGYCFEPRQKVGRPGSYKYYSKEKITPLSGSKVFPGKLSWWGISTKKWYTSDAGKEKGEAERTLVEKKQGEQIYLSLYLQAKDTPGSHYGNVSFTCEIDKLLDSYKEARFKGDSSNVDIYFRKAGTLRYMHEVCYVILICTGKDLEHEGIKEMPPANAAVSETTERNAFEDKSYLNAEGKVSRSVSEGEIDWNEVPCFISEYPVKAVYGRGRKFYTWDHLSFALYFPDDSEDTLILRKEDVDKCPAEHSPIYCHLRKRCPLSHEQ